MDKKLVIYAAKISIIAQLAIFSVSSNCFSEDVGGTVASGNSDVVSRSREVPLSIGNYKPYSWVEQFKVGATLVSEPRRLKNVDVGNVFVLDKSESNIARSKLIFEAVNAGALALATVNADGSFSISPKESVANMQWSELDRLNCAKNNGSDSITATWDSRCAQALNDWLDLPQNSQKYIVASSSVSLGIKPIGQVINWSADVPLNYQYK